MPGRPSKLSRALADVRLQLKSGKTRGQNPRDLDPDEIAALEKTRGVLEAKGKQKAKERAISRINAHTTSEADRVIKAVEEASKPANTYFDAIGGAGSSTDLRLQGKALIERAKEKDRQAKRQATEERRAAAKAEKQRQRIKRGTETDAVAPAPPTASSPRLLEHLLYLHDATAELIACLRLERGISEESENEADGSGGGDGPGAPQVGLPNTISLAPTREVKLNAGLLRELGMVDDSGRLTQLRSTTLIEPLLALALLRNIKKHEMRPKKFPAGPYLIHVGGAKTPPGYKDMLEQEWPDHPPYGSNPCSAIYGLMYLEEPVAAESLDDPWAHLSTWGMRGAWGIEFETPVLQVAGARGVWYLKDETLIAGVQQALVGATLRTFPAGSP